VVDQKKKMKGSIRDLIETILSINSEVKIEDLINIFGKSVNETEIRKLILSKRLYNKRNERTYKENI